MPRQVETSWKSSAFQIPLHKEGGKDPAWNTRDTQAAPLRPMILWKILDCPPSDPTALSFPVPFCRNEVIGCPPERRGGPKVSPGASRFAVRAGA